MHTQSICVIALALMIATPAAADNANPMKELIDGNQRFVDARPTHPDQTAARRADVAMTQRPYAVIVGCSDSRVPPEILFDQGIGDLFVVRSAGHVVGETELGSVEFAVANLGVRLILVLGHERCGAVAAALEGTTVPGHIRGIVDAIKPHLSQSVAETGEPLDNAVRDHVRAVVAQLRAAEPILAPRVRDGTVQVVGAVYDLDEGRVRSVDPAGVLP